MVCKKMGQLLMVAFGCLCDDINFRLNTKKRGLFYFCFLICPLTPIFLSVYSLLPPPPCFFNLMGGFWDPYIERNALRVFIWALSPVSTRTAIPRTPSR